MAFEKAFSYSPAQTLHLPLMHGDHTEIIPVADHRRNQWGILLPVSFRHPISKLSQCTIACIYCIISHLNLLGYRPFTALEKLSLEDTLFATRAANL